MTQRSLQAAASRTGKDFDEVKSLLLAKLPGGRLLTPQEVAQVAISFIDQPEKNGLAQIVKGD